MTSRCAGKGQRAELRGEIDAQQPHFRRQSGPPAPCATVAIAEMKREAMRAGPGCQRLWQRRQQFGSWSTSSHRCAPPRRGASSRRFAPVPQARSVTSRDAIGATQALRPAHAGPASAAAAPRAAWSKGSRNASQSALKPAHGHGLLWQADSAAAKRAALSAHVGRPLPRTRARPRPAARGSQGRPARPPAPARSAAAVARRHQHAGVRRHGAGDRARRGAHHRQAVRQRLGQRHAVAFVEGRQHEDIGARVERAQAGIVQFAVQHARDRASRGGR